MSDFTGMAAVTFTLRALLLSRMEAPVPAVTMAPPDVPISGAGNRVNLYLYQVMENGHLKNQEIPGQGHPGAYGHPPLSLDLHYLLTAFVETEMAADGDLQAQRFLGNAMRVLHDFAIITPDNEFERIKITLQPLNLEEFSKIWTALPQANFRRSVSYHVSVVQIESRRRRQVALPVKERRVYAFPLRSPHITEIVRDPPFEGVQGAIAEVGDTILILGENLAGAATRVKLDDESISVPAPQDTKISLAVPGTITAGLHSVRVTHDLLLQGEPAQPLVPHRGFDSNVVPLLVIPQLVSISPPSAGPGAVVTATIAPSVLARQRKRLLVGDIEVPAEPVAANAPPSPVIDFRLPSGAASIPADTYLVRVRVDGAESRLTIDPITTTYNGPNLTIT